MKSGSYSGTTSESIKIFEGRKTEGVGKKKENNTLEGEEEDGMVEWWHWQWWRCYCVSKFEMELALMSMSMLLVFSAKGDDDQMSNGLDDHKKWTGECECQL